MLYARYIWEDAYGKILDGLEIDHINGDKTDDRIENLQVISKRYNIQKSHTPKRMVLMTCPICGCQFLFEERNLSTKPNPCCSRKCGNIKGHQTRTKNC